jgi:hypothetical protein
VIIGEYPQSRNQELVITQSKALIRPVLRPSRPRSERLNLAESETGLRENLTVELGFPTTVRGKRGKGGGIIHPKFQIWMNISLLKFLKKI